MTVLAHLVAPLNAVLFTLGNDHVTVAETALVYVLFLGMCAAGMTAWRRGLRAAGQVAATPLIPVRGAS